MKVNQGYSKVTLSTNRRAVIASVSVTRKTNTIHCFTEIDITVPRRLIKDHFERTGEKLSMTAYIVSCLAQTLKDFPSFNSFIKGRKMVIMDDITVSVLIERELDGEKVPEPVAIKSAQAKTYHQIHSEIRKAQHKEGNKLGNLSGINWFSRIPGFLLRTFVRIANRNTSMAKKYGKVAVTAVGMFSREPVWFIPHGSATVLLTVGSISNKVIETNGRFKSREHLCLTASFNHNIVDGAPASRFMNQLIEIVKSGSMIKNK